MQVKDSSDIRSRVWEVWSCQGESSICWWFVSLHYQLSSFGRGGKTDVADWRYWQRQYRRFWIAPCPWKEKTSLGWNALQAWLTSMTLMHKRAALESRPVTHWAHNAERKAPFLEPDQNRKTVPSDVAGVLQPTEFFAFPPLTEDLGTSDWIMHGCKSLILENARKIINDNCFLFKTCLSL